MLIKDIKNEEVRNLAIKRCREYSKENAQLSDDKIGEFDLRVDGRTFYWNNTDEGFKFWERVDNELHESKSQEPQTDLSEVLSEIEALREKVIKLMNK